MEGPEARRMCSVTNSEEAAGDSKGTAGEETGNPIPRAMVRALAWVLDKREILKVFQTEE